MKQKKCKVCQAEYMPQRIGQKVCSPKCAIEVAKENSWKERKVVLKELTKTMGDYAKELQKEVNTLARLIDFGQRCISSGQLAKRENGGHLWSVGAYPSLRFNLHNIHLQSYEQNVEKSGNPLGYRIGIKERYGIEYLNYIDELPQEYPVLKPTKYELIDATKKAREIIRGFEKKIRIPIDMMELRNSINFQLGFYS
jgi:Bacteriophage Lambda NinG protein